MWTDLWPRCWRQLKRLKSSWPWPLKRAYEPMVVARACFAAWKPIVYALWLSFEPPLALGRGQGRPTMWHITYDAHHNTAIELIGSDALCISAFDVESVGGRPRRLPCIAMYPVWFKQPSCSNRRQDESFQSLQPRRCHPRDWWSHAANFRARQRR